MSKVDLNTSAIGTKLTNETVKTTEGISNPTPQYGDIELDPVYFNSERNWSERLEDIISRDSLLRSSFRTANAKLIPQILKAEQPGLRAVINIGAGSLCQFLEDDLYKNAYEMSRIDGSNVHVSSKREKVDQLLFGDRAQSYCFGSISLGGTGCRFYGEYCLVICQSRSSNSQIFDRNSYDLLSPPLDAQDDQKVLVSALKGNWEKDATFMLTAKVLPKLPEENRLTTPGQVSDLVSLDEDFAEVHLKGSIQCDDVEEVRTSPEDTAVCAEILENFQAGEIPAPEEFIWANWRAKASRLLRTKDIRSRMVSAAGRGFRWR